MSTTQIWLICSLSILLFVYVTAKPQGMNSFSDQIDLERCHRIAEVDIHCQKCAKVTKSPMAYPMCCGDKEDAYRWCLAYLNFGLQKRSQEKDYPPWERKHLTKYEQKQMLRKHLSSAEIKDMYIPEIDTNMV